MSIAKKIILILFLIIVSIFIIPVGYYILDDAKIDPVNLELANKEGENVGVYLINLDQSTERYEYSKVFLDKLGYKVERISGVDGSKLTEQEIKEKVDLENYKSFMGHHPKLGTIGCSLSHFKVWQKFLESDFKYALIFEDDVSFNPKKLRNMVDELIKIDNLWDIVNFDILPPGLPLVIKKFEDNQLLVVYRKSVFGAGSYLVNRKAAYKLLAQSLPIKLPVDVYFTRGWELGLKFTGIKNPRLVYQTFGDSNIYITNRIPNEKLTMLEKYKGFLFNFQSEFIRYIHNFQLYLSLKS